MINRNKQFSSFAHLTAILLSFFLVFASVGVPVSYAATGGVEARMKAVTVLTPEVIEGDSPEGLHHVYDVQHRIDVPVSTYSGLPTGAKKHHPFTVTTHFSKGIIKFYELCTKGQMSDITIYYYRDNVATEPYFTIELNDALIIDIQHNKPNILNPENNSYGDMASISFTYESITWTYHIDESTTVEYTDSWLF